MYTCCLWVSEAMNLRLDDIDSKRMVLWVRNAKLPKGTVEEFLKPAGSFEVYGANVIESDITASNGVINLIDSILIPLLAKLTNQETARAVIELAIRCGVPLSNAG